jgi:ferric-dicitrate binding protein FerR (iron transport regulator)
MKNREKYSKQQTDLLKDLLETGAGAHITWDRSKEEIWSEMEKKMDGSRSGNTRVIFAPWIKVSMAAALALLIGIAVVMQLYIKTMKVPAGIHSQVVLPDGSLVRLNAQTSISYKPLLWKFSRVVNLEGEAYFEVQRGKKFEVISDNGSTTVLGTSFNIYSRNGEYAVVCITGRVEVSNALHTREIVLQPKQKAILDKEGTLSVEAEMDTEQSLSWLNRKLSFTAQPLQKVFEEISRQYGITIHLPDDADFTYTGTFKRDIPLENALNLVCRPFGLTFKHNSNNEYYIIRNE